MKISFIGHSSFLISLNNGRSILTDPFNPSAYNGAIRYKPYSGNPDIVLISHLHDDHNYRPYDALYIDKTGEYSLNDYGVFVEGLKTYHDKNKGKERGENIIFKFSVENFTLVHCGDVGEIPGEDILEKIKDADFLMIPVGGTYTINGREAAELVKLINPKVVIPMHYKTEYIDFPIDNVDAFLTHLKKDCEYLDFIEVKDRNDIEPLNSVICLQYGKISVD